MGMIYESGERLTGRTGNPTTRLSTLPVVEDYCRCQKPAFVAVTMAAGIYCNATGEAFHGGRPPAPWLDGAMPRAPAPVPLASRLVIDNQAIRQHVMQRLALLGECRHQKADQEDQ